MDRVSLQGKGPEQTCFLWSPGQRCQAGLGPAGSAQLRSLAALFVPAAAEDASACARSRALAHERLLCNVLAGSQRRPCRAESGLWGAWSQRGSSGGTGRRRPSSSPAEVTFNGSNQA